MEVETTKKWASLRQIRAAIGHFELKQYECAMTLAGAGESIPPDRLDPSLAPKPLELSRG
jgi:hypothetical protein